MDAVTEDTGNVMQVKDIPTQPIIDFITKLHPEWIFTMAIMRAGVEEGKK